MPRLRMCGLRLTVGSDDLFLPGVITGVEGTGLLLAAELDPRFPVVGWDGVEEGCRKRGRT